MAKLANVNTRIYVDQYALSGFLNSLSMDIKQELADVTCLVEDSSDVTQLGPRRLPGNYDHSHEHNGFFDGADGAIDAIIDALLDDDDHYLTELFGANAAGSVSYDSIVSLEGKPLSGAVGGAVLLNQMYQGRNRMSRGLVLLNQTATGTVNGTGYDQGVTAATQTYQAVYRILSGTFTSITFNTQQSSDNAVGDPYAAIDASLAHTFSAANTPAVARVTYTGVTEAYKRAIISAFTGTSAVVLVTGGIVS